MMKKCTEGTTNSVILSSSQASRTQQWTTKFFLALFKPCCIVLQFANKIKYLLIKSNCVREQERGSTCDQFCRILSLVVKQHVLDCLLPVDDGSEFKI